MIVLYSVVTRTATSALAAGLLASCAIAERFGVGDDDQPPGTGCAVNADCHDGNPLTTDLCGADGACEHVWNPPDTDPPSTDPVDACDLAAEVSDTGQVTVVADAVPGALSHTLPLSQGRVVHLALRDRQQLRILPADKPDDGLMLVLLAGCANAAVNRLAWGGDVLSPFLDGGDYYLGVFSSEPRTVVLEVRYLEPVTCEDAQPLHGGETIGTVDGHSDSFVGSCIPAGAGGLRGESLHFFSIPDGETGDVLVNLYSNGPESAHYLFLRQGCGNANAVEVACESEGVELPFGTGSRSGTVISLEADGLAPGPYFLFVDAAAPDAFELGEYRLETFFSSQR
ncbi:MAG TPA: hypothetical protein VM285_01405 [Polyangia bacterium]|nr:hypothetical protein [Polyangia bacterium]